MAAQVASQHLSHIQVNPKQGTKGISVICLRLLVKTKSTSGRWSLLVPDVGVLVDTFSGWVKALTTQKKWQDSLTQDYFGFPLRSDKGLPSLIHIADGQEGLDVTWKLSCTYWPQSSGQVKCMNKATKSTLSKLIKKLLKIGPTFYPWTCLEHNALLTRQNSSPNPVRLCLKGHHPLLPSLRDYIIKTLAISFF